MSETDSATATEPTKKKLSLTTMIMIGVGLGLLTGLFFGEACAGLDFVGQAFIRLLQMTILPYIVASLILGIGSLTIEKAKMLAIYVGALLLVFWAIGFVVTMLMPIAFPSWQTASFFSTSLLAPPHQVDFLELYIPANPFNSLAQNVIPAVVLFSLALGIALIKVKEKKTLLDNLRTVAEALTTVAGMIVKLTPIGVFAITASAAGTLTLEELSKLQVYFVSYMSIALFLSIWLLPMLTAAITPFSYREIMRVSRDALLTGFTTGNLFIILPVLTQNCRELFELKKIKTENTDSYIDVVIPVTFNFPNLGKVTMLLFILFALWFSGGDLSITQYPVFIFSGLFSLFGSLNVAVPFLLNLLNVPADLYQLYVITGIINGRFATLLAAMNLLTFTLIAVCAMTRNLRFNPIALGRFGATTAGLLVAIIVLNRTYFEYAVKNEYDMDKQLASMHTLLTPSNAKVYKDNPPTPPPLTSRQSRLDRIKEEKLLRVGYLPEHLPFTFFNEEDQLVGFDVDVANLLAEQLNVALEFIPVKESTMAEQIQRGECDIVMSGIAMNVARLEQMSFSQPYEHLTFAFITTDKKKDIFSDRVRLTNTKGLTIAVVNDSYYAKSLKIYLPLANIKNINTMEEYFKAPTGTYDAVLTSAEEGSAWTLLYPSFAVTIPKPGTVSLPIAYPVPYDDVEFEDFISKWIAVNHGGLRYEEIYNHWILGRGASVTKPRWCIMRNVLGWGD
ncbi:cation:dicarboxylate symporter family transporter [Cerasicoccus arenae]|uniref:ABC transporter substrate-binding protein n=1 Tax=Cerasicoccus arenae TaxID=424488 RepID=A0A8J3DBZ4_9BACT|nr:cation:dicarboxylase symporter family transporter [Cerasicoccus arenae]MBK1859171.1 cation:dicarboxylase symporter family transporter [Cerasicoccus arenae]GHC01056.1 ABC transporter substrate-binding protein [Cerasicoccus arenae]